MDTLNQILKLATAGELFITKRYSKPGFIKKIHKELKLQRQKIRNDYLKTSLPPGVKRWI